MDFLERGVSSRNCKSRHAGWYGCDQGFLLLNEHACDGLRHIIDVARAQCSDADAAAVDRVDRIFFPQPPHLFPTESRIGEHAALLDHEAEIEIRTKRADLLDELASHRL